MGFIKTDTPSSAFKHAKAACADFPLSFPPVPGDRDPPRSVRDVGLQVPSLGCPRLGCGVCRAGGGADPPPPPAAGGDKAPGPPLSLCPPRSDDRRVHPGGGAPGGDPQPRQGAHGEGRHGGTLECGGCHCLSPRALGGSHLPRGMGVPACPRLPGRGGGCLSRGLDIPSCPPGVLTCHRGWRSPPVPRGPWGTQTN